MSLSIVIAPSLSDLMATTTPHPLPGDDFRDLTRPLVGLPVSRPWRGYGSALFLELGRLTRRPRLRGKGWDDVGEATVMIEGSWRVERKRSVAFGSWGGDRKINNGIVRLAGHVVEDIAVTGRLPELVVSLSGGLWVHTFTTAQGQPEWALKVPARGWVSVKRGMLVVEPRGNGSSERAQPS